MWLTDLTEHATAEEKLYVCAIKDAWSNRIVGYSIDERMTSQLVVRAVESAVARRGGDVAGCRLDSDRVAQFRARKVQQALFRHRIHGSMGRFGTSADNAAMESFFSLLHKIVLNRRRWGSRQQLRTAIVSWIERTYHRRRRQAGLCRLTPVEFDNHDAGRRPGGVSSCHQSLQQPPPSDSRAARQHRIVTAALPPRAENSWAHG